MINKKIIILFIGLFVIQGRSMAEIGSNSGPFSTGKENDPANTRPTSDSFTSMLGHADENTFADGDPPGDGGGPGTSVPLDTHAVLPLSGGIALVLFRILRKKKS